MILQLWEAFPFFASLLFTFASVLSRLVSSVVFVPPSLGGSEFLKNIREALRQNKRQNKCNDLSILSVATVHAFLLLCYVPFFYGNMVQLWKHNGTNIRILLHCKVSQNFTQTSIGTTDNTSVTSVSHEGGKIFVLVREYDFLTFWFCLVKEVELVGGLQSLLTTLSANFDLRRGTWNKIDRQLHRTILSNVKITDRFVSKLCDVIYERRKIILSLYFLMLHPNWLKLSSSCFVFHTTARYYEIRYFCLVNGYTMYKKVYSTVVCMIVKVKRS